jgi:serine/threonine protein kinase
LIAEVSPQIQIKIGDLGLAKYTGADAGTELHTCAGTKDYTAPEVLGFSVPDKNETDHYTSAVDIWSSGCLAHTILTNQPPFPGGKDWWGYLNGKIDFPTIALVEKNVSEPARKLLMRMLAPAAHNRPTAEECLEDAWIADVPTNSPRLPPHRLPPRRSSGAGVPPRPGQLQRRNVSYGAFPNSVINTDKKKGWW